MPGSALADLPALELEDSLHGVLVLAQQPGDSPVARVRQRIDHALDARRERLIDLPRTPFGLVVKRSPRKTSPFAGLADCNR
ncbi:hypothetical protein NOR53_3550 [gamma proteobacterium NOR5-3]|nr:hypothetical protein NOR53_3550 [gamma proteobacterium NOR5-3]